MKAIFKIFIAAGILLLFSNQAFNQPPPDPAAWDHQDFFFGVFDNTGFIDPFSSGGSGYELPPTRQGGQFFLYELSGWWNQWFFDGPLEPLNYKKVWIHLIAFPQGTETPSFDVVINWSTDQWSDQMAPPLPEAGFEFNLIGRSPSLMPGAGPVPGDFANPVLVTGEIVIDTFFIIKDYNPVWVSIDVAGSNVQFSGDIWHSCEPGDGGFFEYEFGDAPEDDGQGNVLAYLDGAIGKFPTCIDPAGPANYVAHWFPPMMYFGTTCDAEFDGNAGNCSPFPYNPANYDADECFGPVAPAPPASPPPFIDPGLIVPSPWTITGSPGSYAYTACVPPGGCLGKPANPAVWGTDIDIWVINQRQTGQGFVNVLMDWDQDGQWGGPGEHVLVDFPLPPTAGFVPLSSLMPANTGFTIGPKAGYVWSRFTVSDIPVGPDWNGEGPLPDFVFEDGETEDYLLKIEACPGVIPLSNWAIFLAIGLIVLFTAMIVRRRM